MNAEEHHYLKKLKTLQKCLLSRIDVGKLKHRNYLCFASWDRKSRTFKIHHILKSSKYHVNHIEVESLEKLEELKMLARKFEGSQEDGEAILSITVVWVGFKLMWNTHQFLKEDFYF